MTLEGVVAQVMAGKGLPDDKRLRRHVGDAARSGLPRMARKGLVRRILDEPEQWWTLMGSADRRYDGVSEAGPVGTAGLRLRSLRKCPLE
jgi:hypothetical protein